MREYLKITFPSPAGNGKPHLRQEILPRCGSRASIVTVLYSASHNGQLKGIGSDLLNSFSVIVRSTSGSRTPRCARLILSESSRSCRFIFASPFLFTGNRGRNIRFPDWGR